MDDPLLKKHNVVAEMISYMRARMGKHAHK